jgi:uncharacterized protein DUF664
VREVVLAISTVCLHLGQKLTATALMLSSKPIDEKGVSMPTDIPTTSSGERADVLETLAKHRGFLLLTVRGLNDEQAALHPTASELCLGGLIKHVAEVESGWVDFIVGGPTAMAHGSDQPDGEWDADDWLARFRMLPGERLADLVERYMEVAQRTDELVISLPDLDASHPLPEAPWFEKGASWSARRVLLHIIAETAQHAGHADIIRESLDGAKSMG